MMSVASLIRPFYRFRHAALALAVLFGASSPALAQQNASAPIVPTHMAIATDVLKASGLVTMFQNAMPNVIGGIRANLTRQRPELTKDIEEALKVVEAKMVSATDEGISNVARFLASRMSEAELKEVNTFLISPAGKKYVATLPAFMEDVMPFLEQWNQKATADLTKAFQDEMNKRGHKF